MKIAVVLFNLGGPDSLDAVEPFLRNLFSDPAVIGLPGMLRKVVASIIARRRAPFAKAIYAQIGGRSPILEETEKQAHAIEQVLTRLGHEGRVFIAMRCWKPFSDDTAAEVAAWKPERVVLLPLYPQFSTTTTASSVKDWNRAAREGGLTVPTHRVCCYPEDQGFIAALATRVLEAWSRRRPDLQYRLLLSAHGLPKRTIAKGDPYKWQIERTAEAIVDRLGIKGLDWRICYQSRVGPLEWIGPATDAEISLAGAEGKGVVVAPIAFVSEHSETLVELDIEYAKLARRSGVADYLRVPTVGTHERFIEGLADLVLRAAASNDAVTCGAGRLCPLETKRCGHDGGSV